MNPLMTDDLVRDRQRRLVDQASAHAMRRRARAAERLAKHADRPVRHTVATWLRRIADLLDPRSGARSPGSAQTVSAQSGRAASGPRSLQIVG
jgi:hypothetical protein